MDNSHMKILIVDDELSNLEVISRILKPGRLYDNGAYMEPIHSNYTLCIAKSGQAALKKVVAEIPDLILLDVIMPDMSGFEVLSILKKSEITCNIPVIFITGLDSVEDEEKGFSLGAVDYITKPFHDSLVRARVKTHLRIVEQIRTIEMLGLMDTITNIPNRRGFDNQITTEWGRAIRNKTPVSLLMLDIDHFKKFNDTYGHQQGDVVLQTVAKILKTTLNNISDLVARWGGEEFTAILSDIDIDGALIIAERIRANVAAAIIPNIKDNSLLNVTISIGVATAWPNISSMIPEFIAIVDKALYSAKEAGRNKVYANDGGELELEDLPGARSKLRFSLPFETVFKPEDDYKETDTTTVLQKPVFRGEVLVCEDSKINQEVIKKHLAQVGITAVIADNGMLGLDAVKKRMQYGNPFNLIFIDIHMPVMNGLETMQRLLEIGNKTPVVALTANAITTDKEKYLGYGMSEYLRKPFTAQELWLCLMKYIVPINLLPLGNTNKMNNNPKVNNPLLIINDVLDEKMGIENATGDELFYKRIQRNFYRDNLNIARSLNEAINENDITLAHRIAHTLRSSAWLVGAKKLSLAAGKVEAALSDGKNACSSTDIEELEYALTEVFVMLEPFLLDAELMPDKAAESLNVEIAMALIEKLKPMLKSGNPDSTEYINEVRLTLSPLEKECEMLVRQIENYDFDSAYETICNINIS